MRASQAYLKDKLALLPQPEDVAKLKFLSIENTIAKRRLEERFCLQFVQCVVDDPASQLSAPGQAAAFDRCLRDETLDDYDAIPRDDVEEAPRTEE